MRARRQRIAGPCRVATLASTSFAKIAENVPRICALFFAIRGSKPTVAGADGGHSSMVELQIVVLAVAGSSPVGHPARANGAGSSKSQPPNSKGFALRKLRTVAAFRI